MLEGKPIEVDQAALTGESLPVNKHPWEMLLMGSAIKRGEVKAVVSSTGARTFFGKAAGMIGGVVSHGRLQMVLFRVTMVLLVLSVVLCSVILGKLLSNAEDDRAIKEGNGNKVVSSISVVVVTGITRACRGYSTCTGPLTIVTSCPRERAAAAIARAMRPLDAFVR